MVSRFASRTFGKASPGSIRAAWQGSAVPSGVTTDSSRCNSAAHTAHALAMDLEPGRYGLRWWRERMRYGSRGHRLCRHGRRDARRCGRLRRTGREQRDQEALEIESLLGLALAQTHDDELVRGQHHHVLAFVARGKEQIYW